MPLHGKIVVIKRSGGDGTEFPLSASCLFGRKPDCDIRIQLPQVSKEHCRIDLNENKEVILTNLSSVNPTCVNGQALEQSERLKHGDVITIIDRSFRFEYPPAPTPKKRASVGGKAETVSSDPHLKDGANNDNIQRSLEKAQESESKEDTSLSDSKTASPFSDLYQMIKNSLDVKTPRKSSISFLQTPSSKFCTPKPESTRKNDPNPAFSVGGKITPKKVQTAGLIAEAEKVMAEDVSFSATPKSAKKRRSQQLSVEQTAPDTQEAKQATSCVSPNTRRSATPQKFTVSEAIEQISAQSPKSPLRRSSRETPSPKTEMKKEQKQVASPAKMENTCKATPKSSEPVKTKLKKRKSEELGADMPTQQMKRKRVSFGGHLSPELFDKRMPPDSPLRKGATPRRSLCLLKPKQSLLRRASVIGLLKECDQERKLVKSPKAKSPAKMRTPSPKKSPKAKSVSPKTPTSEKKSPKSPKSQSPAQRAQSPKSKSPSQKAPSPGKKAATPKKASPKTPSPAKKSPKSVNTPTKSPAGRKPETPKAKTPSLETPKRKTPVKTPDQTPTVQGRFSVSRISTPSPIAEVSELVPSATVTPKIPLRRKSTKSSAKKTPALKSATKVMRRKSGMMRTSMKVMASWADIVRFGKAKVQVAVPTKKQVDKKTTKKKAVSKPQTPMRRLPDHVSTGHAASPATIIVGKAHRLRVAHVTGAPPKIVTNTAVSRKNMKMDEDLTGISEMFKTPVNEKKRTSVKMENSATKTPLADVSRSVIEPSVLNTPEETGEMVVSPLSVASAVKGRRYNSEAVQRLLNEDCVPDIPPLDIQSEATEQQFTKVKADSQKTPKQKIQRPEGLTGVKRIMKTPKQRAESVEDLRGRLLKTPKQKIEQQECLTGVKRIMTTPREKAEPVEDLRGKLLKTPKQKVQQQDECLSGVKRIMTTPGQLTGEGMNAEELFRPIKRVQKTPKEKNAPVEDMVGVKRLMKTPKEKAQPVEENFGIKRLMRSPRLRGNPPVEDFEGLEELMKEQPVEDQTHTDAEELEVEAQPEITSVEMVSESAETDKLEKVVIDSETKAVDGRRAKAAEPKAEDKHEAAHSEEAAPVRGRRERKVETSAAPAPRQTRGRNAKTAEQKEPEEHVEEENAPEPVVKTRRGRIAKKASQEQVEEVQVTPSETITVPEAECPPSEATQADEANEASCPEGQKKSVRGRKAKIVEPKAADENKVSVRAEDNKDELSQDVSVAPVRGRRGKKTEAIAAPTVRQMRSRAVKAQENTEDSNKMIPEDVETSQVIEKAPEDTDEQTSVCGVVESSVSEPTEEAVQEKPKRGRKAKMPVKPPQPEPESTAVESEQPVVEDSEPEQAPVTEKPKRGRKAKMPVKPRQPEPESTAVESEQPVVEESEPEQAPVTEKPKGGRKIRVAARQTGVAEDTRAPEEPQQVSQPPIRTKRGRTTELEEEMKSEAKQQTPVEDNSPEPVKRMRRTRKAEQHKDKTLDVQSADIVPEETPVVVEPIKSNEQACIAPKPRRGTKKVQEDESLSPVETTEFQETPVASSTEKPKRGRRGKQVAEITAAVAEEVSEHAPEADSAKPKPTRARGGKSAAKNVSEAVPAKRARRGAAISTESIAEATDEVAEPVPVEPVKRGRRAVTKATAHTEATASKDQEIATKESSSAVKDTKTSKRSVKWKADLEIFTIPQATPVKAVRGRKTKSGEQKKADSNSVPQNATNPDEKDLSDKQSQPAKRARRGTKAVEVAEESANKENVDIAEAEKQPKTRRGRSAKK